MSQQILSTPDQSRPRPEAVTRPRRSGRARRVLRRLAFGLLVILGVLALAAGAGALWLRSEMRASLPQLDGARPLPGLSAPVRIERDALGVPAIRGKSRLDVARATGFLHAQERFFQMDLMRRQAAGELSELFGAAAVEADQANRLHRFRHRAGRGLRHLSPSGRALVEAYAGGVNAGLAALGAPPFEYLALRAEPAPWRPEDSLLVAYAMFFTLQDADATLESVLGVMHETLPPAAFAFLAPRGGPWEAPLVGKPLPLAPVPSPAEYDLRALPRAASLVPAAPPEPRAALAHLPWAAAVEEGLAAGIGSNNWAVSGAHTASGRALLANDMHLPLRVPNTWYRASLVWPGADGGERRVTGVTLPGVPAVVVGSNGRVAWGFTNSYGDFTDLVVLEVDPRRPDYYRTPQGWRRFERVSEPIRVKGGATENVEVVATIWGPVVDRDHRGRQRALAWTAHRDGAVDQEILRLEEVRDVEEAIAVAHASGIPAQNFVAADAGGRIAWTIIGRLPRRVGFDGRLPGSWADGSRRWDGWLAPEEVPAVLDPPSGRIWTANSRVVGGEMLARIGDGGYDEGARARQIRDGLARIERAKPADMLAVQLDDRALFLAPWRGELLRALDERLLAGDAGRRELRRLVEESWTGRASVDSVGYRLVRSFRQLLAAQALGALTAPCLAADPRFRQGAVPHAEGPLWRLLTERPAHLLDPRFETWDQQIAAVVDEIVKELGPAGEGLARRTWGERNTVRVQHPLSRAVPGLGRMLDVPPLALPGDFDMPRVQGPLFGASERLAVSPGLEAEGYFHMPTGQSGHPLSPHYQSSHGAWAGGEPTPFLPGKPASVLVLAPAARP